MRKLVGAGIGFMLSLGLAGMGFAAGGPPKSVTGNLEDSYCWTTTDAQGPGHKKCATECARKGIPVSLVEKGTGHVFILLPPGNKRPLPDDVISHMEDEVTVSGREFSKGGVNYLTVESVK